MGVLSGTRGLSSQLSCLQEKARGKSAIKKPKPCEIYTWNSNLHRFCYIAASSESLSLHAFQKTCAQTSFGASSSFSYISGSKLRWLLAPGTPWKMLFIDIMSPFGAQLSSLSSEKHVSSTGVSGRKFKSQSSFFFTFSPQMGVLYFVWVGKKIRHLCFLLALLFWKALLRKSSPCTEIGAFPLVIACVWLVLLECNSHFQGSNVPQISLLTCSKHLRFLVASWGSYRKPRDTPDFGTGLSQSCFSPRHMQWS